MSNVNESVHPYPQILSSAQGGSDLIQDNCGLPLTVQLVEVQTWHLFFYIQYIKVIEICFQNISVFR